jgi:multiple sugar transport system substrate-binding protein
VLKGAGAAALGAAAAPMLGGCVTGGTSGGESAGAAASGAFDWKRHSGKTVNVLQTPHVYVDAYEALWPEFEELTGITVKASKVPEADYFTQLTTELQGKSTAHDVFMLGAYYVWQYGPPGWLEDLTPYIQNSSLTSDEYDFEDIQEGLRNATRWDFQKGTQTGTGGQWALPWGFELNNIGYNKKYFDEQGINIENELSSFDNMIDFAVRLTDRSANRYGIAFRGSRSWATIHPGFMTQYSREGFKDYTFADGKFTAGYNTPDAVAFCKKWADLAKNGGPTGWTTYEYPNCTGDLGDGTAMMCYDADSATYPKQKGDFKQAGNLGWHPGPPGASGSYATNLWTWCYAMNSAISAEQKEVSWLFLQWVTGKDAMTKATAVPTGFADPTRKSVFDGAFKATLGDYPGYADAYERTVGESGILFTPQVSFMETTEQWAVALQEIYEGKDAQASLDAVAKANEAVLNA